MLSGTARTIATDAGVLRYREVGHGPPLVLLHGSGPGVTGWGDFRGNLPAFAEFFRCLIPELPVLGVGDHDGDDTTPAAHDVLARFIDVLKLECVDIIGNSTGGGVALDYVIRHPDKVHRLVTVGGIAKNMFTVGPGAELLREFSRNPSREKLVEWLHSMVHNPASVADELIEECWAQVTRNRCAGGGLAQLVNGAAGSAGYPGWEALQRVQAPTLLTWGRDDVLSPVGMALAPMRSIPNAQLHVFPNCGHWAMIDQKEAFENVVLSFLLRSDPPGYQPGRIGAAPGSSSSALMLNPN